MPRIRLSHIFWVVGLLAAVAVILPWFGKTSKCGPKTLDASNLRQIAQASIIYAYNHEDRFPEATDVWDFAGKLARSVGINTPDMWQSKRDPAWIGANRPTEIIRDATPRRPLDPGFLQIKPSIAVPLGQMTTAMPATTPIAWTRGLQPDGTWAKHSPYGDEGGYIAFLNGGVQFFKTLIADGGELTRFDQSGRTANILEALPPGTRIGEYVPTPKELKSIFGLIHSDPH